MILAKTTNDARQFTSTIQMNLNETEKDALCVFLDLLSQQMSNAGCNDFKAPDTEEGRQMIKEVYEHSLDPADWPDNLGLYCDDWMLLSLLRTKLGIPEEQG